MRGITAHGLLLAVMLVLAYQAWTPDDSPRSSDVRDGSVTVWQISPDDVRSVTYQRAERMTVIERREDGDQTYLWGRSYERPSGGGVVRDSIDAADSVAPDTAVSTMEEFPVGEEGEEIWDRLSELRALRDLGVLDDAAKAEYELEDVDRHVTVTTIGGERTLDVGGTVFASTQRYAFDPASGRGYVLAESLVRMLEGGPAALRLRTPHRFAWDEVGAVTVRGTSGERVMTRRGGGSGSGWVSADVAGAPDQTFENFMNHVEALAFTEFASSARADTMQFLLRVDYQGEREEPLGFLELYRVPVGEPGTWDYYLQTEATRIPARLYRSLAERVDRGIADLF